MAKGTKNQRELLEFLGPEYSMKTIDFGPSLYRRLNDRYDVEILSATRKGRPASVYVWDISRGVNGRAVIVERHSCIRDRDALKELLDELAGKYGAGGRRTGSGRTNPDPV